MRSKSIAILAISISMGSAGLMMSADKAAAKGGVEGSAACSRSVRIKNFPARDHYVLRSDGIIGSRIKGLQVSIIELVANDCTTTTMIAMDYSVYNHWTSAGTADALVSIDLKSGETVVRKAVYIFGVPLGFCGPYGTSGKAFHVEDQLFDNVFDVADEIVITGSRISGRIDQC